MKPSKPPPRGARAGPRLTPAGIVDAALALVAQDGLAQLSTRRLGDRLGCEAMSIYHHFPSKQHLLDALVDRVIGSLEWPDPALPPLQRVRAAVHAYRDMARRHPALFPYVAVHRLNTPTGVRFIEGILALVQAVVPDPERAARHFRVLGYYLMGAGLDETAGYAKGPTAAEPVDDAHIATHCPRLMASARWFQPGEWDRTFELGVDALLAAMARDAAPAGQGMA
ncbi:MAG: TetR/AcrR family transcriptional regulator [Rubrivivax sp.]